MNNKNRNNKLNRKPTTTRKRGQHYEELAKNWLEAQGLITLHNNFHSRFGELDLIMADSETLVFVEVRYRTSSQFGGALASVDTHKQQKLYKAAQHFLACHKKYMNHYCRFDVLAMESSNTQSIEYQWIQNAFQGKAF